MKNHHPRFIALMCGLLVAAVLFGGTHAMAAISAGPRAGFSTNPDQFVIGGQAAIGSIMPMIQLVPSLDFGFGSDVSITAVNIDLQYNLPSLPKVSPNFYIGAGPTFMLTDHDDASDTGIGLSLLAGLRIPMTGLTYYNLETRFGLRDVPDVKVLLGIMFGL